MWQGNIDRLPLVRATRLETKPEPQACALTGNGTDSLCLGGTTLQPTEPHQSGRALFPLWEFFLFFLKRVLKH